MQAEKVERPKLYTYAGIVVRLCRGKLEPVYVTGPMGRQIAPARRTKYMPLPKPLRRALGSQARKAAQIEKLARLNVKWPDAKPAPWTDVAVPTGATL